MRPSKLICYFAIIGLSANNRSYYTDAKASTSSRSIRKTDDCPVIDYSKKAVTSSDCDKSNGSITGLQIASSGTKQFFTWRDALKNIVGNKLDLKDVPAGTYTLEVSDNSSCRQTVFSTPLVVGSLKVAIDEKNTAVKNSGCAGNGSITGIKVTNATKYVWYSQTSGKSITTITPDLLNVPVGEYQLTASNDNGCSAQGGRYTIVPDVNLPRIASTKTTDATCALGSGNISASLYVDPNIRIDFYFMDENGNHVADGVLSGGNPNPTVHVAVDQGSYGLYVVGPNGCDYLIQNYKVNFQPLEVLKDQTIMFNDKCDQHIGAIDPILNGPTTPKVTTFTWTDETGAVVGHFKFLNEVGAGTYTLKVFDPAAGCNAKASFTIVNESPEVIPPISGNITMCLPGITGITVKNIDTTNTYNIYNSPTSTTPVYTNKEGEFFMNVKETTDFYLSAKHADCESTRTKVHVFVAASGINIPTAFTPNNDGVNDIWNIANIDKFPGAEVSVFNRAGQQVYYSLNYSKPFDGRYGGKQLDVGVYYYIIDLKIPICFGKISGNLTIIR